MRGLEVTTKGRRPLKGKGATAARKLKEIYCKDGLVRISVIKIKKIQGLGDMRKFEVR